MDGHLDQNCPSIFHLPPGCSTLSAFHHGDCSRISCLGTSPPPHTVFVLATAVSLEPHTAPGAQEEFLGEPQGDDLCQETLSHSPRTENKGQVGKSCGPCYQLTSQQGKLSRLTRGAQRARQTSAGHQRASGERMDRHPLPQRPLHSLRPLQGRLLLCNTLPTPRTSGFLTELDWPGKYLFYGNLNTASVT